MAAEVKLALLHSVSDPRIREETRGDISAFIRSPFVPQLISPLARPLAHVWTLDDDSRHILLVHVEERRLPRDPTIHSRFIHNSEDFGEDLLERNESSMFGRFGWPF